MANESPGPAPSPSPSPGADDCNAGASLTPFTYPDGLKYIDSWVEPNFDRCFQLMETDDLRNFQVWISAWSDLIEFEIVPVVTSKDTREAIGC